MRYWDLAGNTNKYSTFSAGAWAETDNVGALTNTSVDTSGQEFHVAVGAGLAFAFHWDASAEI